MSDEQPERLCVKALFHYLNKIVPRGLAVKDEETGEMFCIFVTEDEEGPLMKIQKSKILEYDLVECDITEHLN